MNEQFFVGFIVGGDGGVQYSIDCALELIAGGVDVLEIGLPFSDPVADGPVIEQAAVRALKSGTTPDTLLEIARGIRKKVSTPLILFSYFNPLLKKGEPYLKELKEAGFNAVLVVDLPPPDPFFTAVKKAGLYPISLVSPSTDDKRLAMIAELSEGFIYYACQKGTTGMRDKLPEDTAGQIKKIRQYTDLPIAIGFGIGDRSNAATALEQGDGFVVGSAIVALMEKHVQPKELKTLAKDIDPRSN